MNMGYFLLLTSCHSWVPLGNKVSLERSEAEQVYFRFPNILENVMLGIKKKYLNIVS